MAIIPRSPIPHFNSTKVQFRESSGLVGRLARKDFNSTKVQFRVKEEKVDDKAIITISIPLRYNLEPTTQYGTAVSLDNFNSTKVQFGE